MVLDSRTTLHPVLFPSRSAALQSGRAARPLCDDTLRPRCVFPSRYPPPPSDLETSVPDPFRRVGARASNTSHPEAWSDPYESDRAKPVAKLALFCGQVSTVHDRRYCLKRHTFYHPYPMRFQRLNLLRIIRE